MHRGAAKRTNGLPGRPRGGPRSGKPPGPRPHGQADGGLPMLPHLRPAANSALIDKGTNAGLPYTGSAPDLGAFERAS